MQVLNRDVLPLGGFAGLTEHRLVTDSRVFGRHKSEDTFNGHKNFVYLADARFNPHGETRMHPHKEIDVISVMLDGRISHEGSLEHGQSLNAGEVQVQRAGGEGFEHNEVNPDNSKNRMLQIWVLPDEAGRAAGYKHYALNDNQVTRIYGGDKNQTQTFDSKTIIDIVQLNAGEEFEVGQTSLIYVATGEVKAQDNADVLTLGEGALIRSEYLKLNVSEQAQLIVVS